MDNAKTDFLHGLKAVAAYANLTPRQAKHRAAIGELPTFKIGKTVCSRRSLINTWLDGLAAKERN